MVVDRVTTLVQVPVVGQAVAEQVGMVRTVVLMVQQVLTVTQVCKILEVAVAASPTCTAYTVAEIVLVLAVVAL